MPLLDWIPTEELQLLVKYMIADLVALSIFKVITLYGGFLFPTHHDIIINIEMYGLFLLIAVALVLLIAKIARIGWKGVWHGKTGILFA